MIEDAKLRVMFKAESEEHILRLDETLLRLDRAPGDAALLEEAFREAHSLKGAARMLGLNALVALAHELEDGLNAARRGSIKLDSTLLANMSRTLAELGIRAREAVGEGVTNPKVEARAEMRPPAPPREDAGDEPAGPATEPVEAFRITSVRVGTERLDELMTHAGELMVTRARISHRLAELDALAELVEESLRRGGARPAGVSPWARMEEALVRLRASLGEDSARLDAIADELGDRIRRARLLPLSSMFRLFPRLVHDMGQEQGKEIEFVIQGGEAVADKRVLEEMKDPLMHMLRNAVTHGIESPAERERAGKPRAGSVRVEAVPSADGIAITVRDDGRGLDMPAIRRAALRRGLVSAASLDSMTPVQVQSLVFRAGLSTAGFVTDDAGRGVGLDVVRANVERLKGSIELTSDPGRGTRIAIRLPVTLSTARVLIVRVGGHPYGLPVQDVVAVRFVAPEDIFTLEGRSTIRHAGEPVPLARLADLLELRGTPPAEDPAPGRAACVLVASEASVFAVLVDSLVDEQELVLRPQCALLARVRNVAGAAILDSGDICIVLNARDLLDSIRRHVEPTPSRAPEQPQAPDGLPARRKRILLAEDSLITRTQEAHILEGAGYEVVTAVDGLDAFNKLAAEAFDAVVTDILMPNMTGLALAERIRADPRHADLPIVLVTSLASDEDKRRGLEAGANAYITKSAFDQKLLLGCLERLV